LYTSINSISGIITKEVVIAVRHGIDKITYKMLVEMLEGKAIWEK
jgi:hypothetical protein